MEQNSSDHDEHGAMSESVGVAHLRESIHPTAEGEGNCNQKQQDDVGNDCLKRLSKVLKIDEIQGRGKDDD